MSKPNEALHDSPAFPGQMPTGMDPRSGNFEPGMTLRQWFAGLAMQGELAYSQEDAQAWSEEMFPALVKRCYKLADLMIKGPQD